MPYGIGGPLCVKSFWYHMVSWGMVNIGQVDNLLPVWHLAFIRTDDLLLIWSSGTSWKFNQDRMAIFIQQNAFQNTLCKVAAILISPQCFNPLLVKVIVIFTCALHDAKSSPEHTADKFPFTISNTITGDTLWWCTFILYIHTYIHTLHACACMHTYIHTCIHICWFNFDALAQGNAYKPTKEPINYRGPGGDRTHDLQTEATPPAASCPARTLHATEIAPKNATSMTCPWLHWTISTPVCVNFELRPGAGDIHICWFNFDALAQGNAYKPTKEPINYRGPGGDRTHDLQTEATPPAASCPARTLHATEIAPKNATSMTCPWLHWTTDNLSGMHMVSISTPVCVNFELRPGAGDIHICWFNFDALAQGNAYKPTKEPINYRGPGGDRTHDLQTEATLPAASCPARTLHATEIAPKNATSMTCPWLHWTTDNLSGMHMVSISTPVCVNFELRPGAGDIHICWFNFDALAQGNAYKPTKEPINYRGPGGDRTHDLQTEATLPAASCPARTLHATEIAPKNATSMTCPWLHWTTDNLSGMHMVSISTPVCVNFELRPGAGDIHICWFNFDALAQGNAYKPTKEPINYRGPGGDRTHDLQTEATLPAASCPARTLHATEIAPKNATSMTCPWLHWTTDNLSGMHMVSISTPVCVNFELRPGTGDICNPNLILQVLAPY